MAKENNDRLVDFETKKSVHINLTRDTHTALRIICFQNKLSMQEVVEELVIHAVEEQPYVMNIIKELVDRKRNSAIAGAGKRFAKSDAESIFRVIEDSNPFESSPEDDTES